MSMTFSDIPSAWLPLLDSVVKGTIVLGAAGAATCFLRHASAALRHLIWTLGLTSALVMPLLSMALPRWQLPIPAIATVEPMPMRLADRSNTAAPPPAAHLTERTSTARTSGSVIRTPTAAAARPISELVTQISWQRAVAAVWVMGVVLIVGRVLVGLVVVQWMSRRGQRVLDAPWMKMAVELASAVGVSSNITFLRSGRATMPMACGVLRPAVMMPDEADGWPSERLRIVLLHELAHVKRHDCLTHVVAQLACALHWFNPLAWIAARNVRTERERACDDLVLAAGTPGPDYADQLLEIARVMRPGRYPAVLAGASLAMAQRSQLEGRLMAILDPRVPHAALTRLRAAAATTLCCAAVVPLAAVQPWAEATQSTRVAEVAFAAPDAPKPVPAAPAPAPSPAPSPARLASAIVEATGTTAEAVADAIADHADIFAQAVESEADHQAANTDDDEQELKPSPGKGDPRMVAALTAALKDTDKEVRETALHALVQMRDPSILEPLVQALKDAAPGVREQAAFGLGQLRDRRAVEPLSAALKDQHADVRRQAAFALGQMRDRSAIPALTAAMKDTDADVRGQVVFALGQIRDPAAVEGLTIALRDANGDVRKQAAFALGQLRDRRAVEPLVSALKDSDADVRQQAAFALGQLRDRGAVEALAIALKDSAAGVREQVAFALGQLGDPRAIDGLTAALKDPQAGVRRQAAFALGQLAR